jgi:hypothetical protein
MQTINTHSSMEPAGSHGKSLIAAVGATTIRDENSNETSIQKVWLAKGISWPLDGGVNFGYSQENKVKQVGAYLQYAFFEKFAWPAFSIQTNYSLTKIASAEDLKIETVGLKANLSWGYGPISLYGSLGIMQHKIKARLNDADFSLASLSKSNDNSQTSVSSTRIAGIYVHIPMTLWIASLESNLNESKVSTVSAKLGIQL